MMGCKNHGAYHFLGKRDDIIHLSTPCHVMFIYTGKRQTTIFIGCFHWMIPNLCLGNGCFTKHPLKNGCLEYQVQVNDNVDRI